jgi:hypothetical protein
MTDITDLQIGQGESFVAHLQLQYLVGNSYEFLDISNYTFEGQIRENYTTDEIAAQFNIELGPQPDAGVSGSLRMSLAPEQTSELHQRHYVYDIKMITSDDPPVTRRILEGGFFVRPATTR